MRISDWSSDVCSSDLAVEKVIDVHQGHSLSIRRKLPASCHKMPGMKRVMRPCSTGCLGRRLISENARSAAHCPTRPDYRSEEHTSELQSLMRISYAVFCLKKKITNYTMFNRLHSLHT